jgi:hypothetical protein
MKHMVLIGEVATLAKDIERFSGDYANNVSALPNLSQQHGTLKNLMSAETETNSDVASSPVVNAAEAASAFVANRNAGVASLEVGAASQASARSISEDEFSKSEQLKLSELLDAWEEPQTAEEKEVCFVEAVDLVTCDAPGSALFMDYHPSTIVEFREN